MNKEEVTKFISVFDEIKHQESSKDKKEGIEFWFARDLQKLFEYSEWRKFLPVIEKAKQTCKNSKHEVSDHFAHVDKMVEIGSNAKREVEDIMLTRYACYLIAQNGDPRKEVIAFAQTYFATQTRKQELLEERLEIQERLKARKKLTETEKELSSNIYQRGVDNQGFGRIRAKGDKALFNNSTAQMKERLGVKDNRALADFLPTITIKAKDFAAEITNFNVNKENLQGEHSITSEHIKNNKEVRDTLTRRGIKPEELPAEDDIKKVERKLNSDSKKLGKGKFEKEEIEG
jgi:DNA-damage-inducible protein D